MITLFRRINLQFFFVFFYLHNSCGMDKVFFNRKNMTNLKSPCNQNWQLLFLWNIAAIINDLSMYIFLNSCALMIFKQNNFPFLLQQHLFSSLITCLLAQGRDNLSLTWDRQIANHNYPMIQSVPSGQNQVQLEFFFFYSDMSQ